MNRAEAPSCWLFNDEELGHTEERALQIRQLIAVTDYLSSLHISDDRKATLLHLNREVLGVLYYYLTAKRVNLRRVGKCVLM